MGAVLLSTAYLGPIQYYSKFFNCTVLIEQHETYIKQTYRNRCKILTGNGVDSLTIPVVRPQGNSTSVKDVRLDNTKRWQKQHWRALSAAYNNTPFFEFYADDFYPFYEKEYTFLLDFNEGLNRVLLKALNIETDYSYTESYMVSEVNDFRETIHPKKEFQDKEYKKVAYYQVFSDRFGFVSGLSIVDLLFNSGPESYLVLKDSLANNTKG